MIDYHIHTSLCNHAEHGMAGYVLSAIEKGLSEICFLDHLTTLKTDRQTSMTVEEVPHYLSAVRQMEARFRDRIAVKAGLEMDFIPEDLNLIEEISDTCALDVIGSSIHFVEGINIASRRTARHITGDAFKALCDTYLSQIDRMLDHDYFDFICHLDLPKKFNQPLPASFHKEMDAILDKIAEKGVAVELNTSGLYHPVEETYPSPDILGKCFKKGILVTLSSDSHKHSQVGREFDKALSLLRAAGYDSVTGFSRRKPYRIPIKNFT